MHWHDSMASRGCTHSPRLPTHRSPSRRGKIAEIHDPTLHTESTQYQLSSGGDCQSYSKESTDGTSS
eukprot:3343781-Amphidinium_carterae.3